MIFAIKSMAQYILISKAYYFRIKASPFFSITFSKGIMHMTKWNVYINVFKGETSFHKFSLLND